MGMVWGSSEILAETHLYIVSAKHVCFSHQSPINVPSSSHVPLQSDKEYHLQLWQRCGGKYLLAGLVLTTPSGMTFFLFIPGGA
jgi:hypothetical protein